jgi:hypothetical protein
MKRAKLLIMLLGIVGFSTSGFSQDKVKTIEKGDFLLNPYVTLGWYNYGYSLDVVNIFPPVGVNFEIATSDYFSFGLEGDYGLRRYRDLYFTTGSYEYDYVYKALSFRGSFHYLDWLKDIIDENVFDFHQIDLDLYAGASTGIFTTTIKESWNDVSDGLNHERKTFSSQWQFGYILGARYYFSNNFGVFAEGGRNSLGWAKLGLTLKI